ncbi:hypothetical protein ACI2OX_08590 [Bacillus sp. N9]
MEGTSLYYLMPWLENKLRDDYSQRHHQLFRELARLHTLSVREVPVSKEERKEHFDQTTARWEKEQEALENYVEISERAWYMSLSNYCFAHIFMKLLERKNMQ